MLSVSCDRTVCHTAVSSYLFEDLLPSLLKYIAVLHVFNLFMLEVPHCRNLRQFTASYLCDEVDKISKVLRVTPVRKVFKACQ